VAAPATGSAVAEAVASGQCSVCGGSFPLQDLAQFGEQAVCGACKPRYVQSLREGTVASLVVTYAGFWTRFGAIFLDGIILWVVNTTIQLGVTFGLRASLGETSAAMGMMVLIWVLQFGIGATYETYMLGKYGATLGKMAAKIRVVRADGSPLTYGRAFGRYCAKIVSALLLYVGFIMAGFDKEKRALHDHMCGTRVIKV
jgi:uncharacterized RDD family membrane protein YckC